MAAGGAACPDPPRVPVPRVPVPRGARAPGARNAPACGRSALRMRPGSPSLAVLDGPSSVLEHGRWHIHHVLPRSYEVLYNAHECNLDSKIVITDPGALFKTSCRSRRPLTGKSPSR